MKITLTPTDFKILGKSLVQIQKAQDLKQKEVNKMISEFNKAIDQYNRTLVFSWIQEKKKSKCFFNDVKKIVNKYYKRNNKC